MTDEAAAGDGDSTPEVDRRGFLRGVSMAAVGLAGAMLAPAVAGCAVENQTVGPRAGGRSGTPTGPTATTPPEPDARLALAAAAAEAALADFCGAALKAEPRLRSVLRPLRFRQREHIAALRGAVAGVVPPGIAPSMPPSGQGTPMLPRRASDVLTELERRLAAAERQRFDDCLAAESGSLARMLGSLSASHAQSLVVLRRSS